MLFKDFLKRANCQALENFILHGGEYHVTPASRPLEVRFREAEEALEHIFCQKSKNDAEFEQMMDAVLVPMGELQEVFFEAGLLAGAKITYELCSKIKDVAS